MAKSVAFKTPDGMALPCCGIYEHLKAESKDGTTFTPAIFYNVGARNIGIIRKSPDEEAVALANTLWAVPDFAGDHARSLAKDWDYYLTQGNPMADRKAVDICWDIDNPEAAKALPNEIDIPVDLECGNVVSDYIKDLTGHSHGGFTLVYTGGDDA